MPSPEALGVSTFQRAEQLDIDWKSVHERLNQLGATCFHQERLPQGAYRVTCLLPTRQSKVTHRIEAEASTEAECVHLALARAEEWVKGQ
jgi:hypothetical protein